MTVTLFEHPLSPYSQKNKIALREKAVAFDAVTPDAFGSGHAAGVFAAANPRAEVPALIHGDTSVFDSTIIQDYIEESWPTPALLPATPAQRARVRMIEEVMDTQYEAITWGLMEVHFWGRAPGAAGEALVARAHAQLAGLHDWLTEQLGQADWFNGAAFGWGDIAAIPFVLGAGAYGAGPAPDSAIGRWVARCMTRASVAQTAAEAQATIAMMQDTGILKAALASGAFKREYRDHRLEWMLRSGGIDVLRDGLAAGNIRFGHELKGTA